MREATLVSGPPAWERLGPVLFDERRRSAGPAEAAGVTALCGLAAGDRVLDLGCGQGRHCVALAELGIRATGVDVTGSFLAEAARRAGDAAVEAEWVQADMRSFRRPDAFDAVTCMSTSFGYFEDEADDSRVLANALASLRPRGRLLLELVSREVLARMALQRLQAEQDGVLLQAERRMRPDGRWAEHHLRFTSGDSTEEFLLAHRLWSAGELTALVTTAGFVRPSCFGDLAGSPYGDDATRLVLVAEKPLR